MVRVFTLPVSMTSHQRFGSSNSSASHYRASVTDVVYSLCPNDRSLFTFLTSEPLSFKSFLDEATIERDALPTLKLYQVYDYFVESVGMGLASRPTSSGG